MYGVMVRLNGLAYKKVFGIVFGILVFNKIMCFVFFGCAIVVVGGVSK